MDLGRLEFVLPCKAHHWRVSCHCAPGRNLKNRLIATTRFMGQTLRRKRYGYGATPRRAPKKTAEQSNATMALLSLIYNRFSMIYYVFLNITCRLCFLRDLIQSAESAKIVDLVPSKLLETIRLVALTHFYNFRIHHLVLNDLGSTSLHVRINIYVQQTCICICRNGWKHPASWLEFQIQNSEMPSKLRLVLSRKWQLPTQSNSWRSIIHWARQYPRSHFLQRTLPMPQSTPISNSVFFSICKIPSICFCVFTCFAQPHYCNRHPYTS